MSSGIRIQEFPAVDNADDSISAGHIFWKDLEQNVEQSVVCSFSIHKYSSSN